MAPKEKAKKPVYATADEVIEAEEKLVKQIQELKDESAVNTEAVEKRLQEALAALTAKVDLKAAKLDVDSLHQDARSFTQSSLEELRKVVDAVKATLDGAVQSQAAAQLAELRKVEKDLKKEIAKNVSELTDVVEEELKENEKRLRDEIEATARAAEQGCEAMGSKVMATQQDIRDVAARDTAAAREAAAEALRQAVELQETTFTSHVASSDESHAKASARADELHALIEEHRAAAAKSLQATHDELKRRNDELRSDSADRFDYGEREFEKLRMAIEEVENTNTRRVDWVISGISRHLGPDVLPNDLKHRSLFSPRFNMAGCYGLQLELQYIKPNDRREPGSEAGDAAVFLWACKGTTMNFRLYIGTRYQTFEKTFNGRMPHGSTRLCFLKNQIDHSDDSLTVSVEVLESHREIERVIESECKLERPIGLKIDAPENDGIIRFHRHIDHQVLDKVKGQVDLMRSRLVRKVEWRVEQAARLPQCFGAGEPVCSPPFTAAGIEGIQLLLYPSGYFGANDGYCSLFVYGPAGATLKCLLTLAGQKREASHTFVEAGCFGRANFCRFEQAVDVAEDVVLVGIEIIEAHQDTIATASHASQQDGAPSDVKSTVKLREAPGKGGVLEATQILPSVWSKYFQGSITQPPDGLHSFDELKAAGRRGGEGGRRGLGSGGGSSPNLSRGSPLPQLGVVQRNQRPR